MIYFLLVVPVFMILLLAVMKSAKSADDQIAHMLEEEGIRCRNRPSSSIKHKLVPQMVPINKNKAH